MTSVPRAWPPTCGPPPPARWWSSRPLAASTARTSSCCDDLSPDRQEQARRPNPPGRRACSHAWTSERTTALLYPSSGYRLSTVQTTLADVLRVVGERWTLLVVREIALGLRRFDEIHEAIGAPRAVLSDRLKRLVEAGRGTPPPHPGGGGPP